MAGLPHRMAAARLVMPCVWAQVIARASIARPTP